MARMPYSLFLENIVQFVNMSNIIGDRWKIQEDMGKDNMYIKKEIVKDFESSQKETPECSGMLFWEYHVVYSCSYGVPVLCVNIRNLGEKRKLTAKDVWNLFNSKNESSNMHMVLTEQDHPVLQTPIFILHPCKTHELLEHVIETSKNPLVSWLSAVGPSIQLNLDEKYEILTSRDNFEVLNVLQKKQWGI